MNVDYSKPNYVTVPEGYRVPEPRKTSPVLPNETASHPVHEQYHSSSDDVGECLGPEGIMGKLFPQNRE